MINYSRYQTQYSLQYECCRLQSAIPRQNTQFSSCLQLNMTSLKKKKNESLSTSELNSSSELSSDRHSGLSKKADTSQTLGLLTFKVQWRKKWLKHTLVRNIHDWRCWPKGNSNWDWTWRQSFVTTFFIPVTYPTHFIQKALNRSVTIPI